MMVQGALGGVGTSIALTAHSAGDIIIIVARAASNTAPTVPAAGGTVPVWNVVQTGGANTLALVTAWARATSTNHTTGTWTGASHICFVMFHPDAGKDLNILTSSLGNANNTQTIVYPALTLANATGSSWGVRCGTRGVAIAAVSTPPTNWGLAVGQPGGAGALMAIHYRQSLVTNPTADTVTTTSSNAPYRAHTIEVGEGPKQQPVVTIA